MQPRWRQVPPSLISFDDGDVQPELLGPDRGDVAPGAAAKQHQVIAVIVCLFGHQ
jgi:hypothetical protein